MITVALDEVCEIDVGRTPSRTDPSLWGSGHPWLSIADMKQGLEISKTREQITDAGARGAKLVAPGTVVLSFKLSIGKVGITTIPLYTNEAIAALPIKDANAIDPRYLLRALEATNLAGTANRAAMGATLNKQALKQLRVPLPPLVAQRRIAAILDRADAIRAKHREIGAHLAALTPSIFRSMFTGISQRSRLGELANTTSGGTPSRAVSANFGGDIPWVKSGELHSGVVTETEEKITSVGLASSSAKLLPAGTVLLAMYGATAGVVGRLGIEAATNQAVCSITPGPRLDAEYLVHALRAQTEALVSRASGGAQPNLSQATVRDFEIPVPDIADQRCFAKYSNAVTQRQLAAKRAVAAADELFASLQSRAFRGEL